MVSGVVLRRLEARADDGQENPVKVPMVLIEMQTGTFLGKADSTCHDDVCARDQAAKG